MIKIDIRTVIYHYILFHLGKQGKSLLKHKLQSHFQPLFHIPLFPQKNKKAYAFAYAFHNNITVCSNR